MEGVFILFSLTIGRNFYSLQRVLNIKCSDDFTVAIHMDSDDIFMDIALGEARLSLAEGEVPIGAVITRGGEIIARAHNRPIATHDPSAHAEIAAIREAAMAMGNYRLVGTTLYATLEPCIMCAGAIVHARIERLVFGARDKKGGGVVSLYTLLNDERLNHFVMITEGIRREACEEILSGFFRGKRITSPPA
jgi:tRNA(adenine34) deaminase